MKNGIINYRQFDDDIYYINKKEKTRGRTKDDKRKSKSAGRRNSKSSRGRDEEGTTKEIDYSLRPTHNMPDDNRYSMKNTVVGRFPDSRTQERHKIKISDSILQDIIKATYTRDILVGDAFKRFGKGRNAVVSEADFKEALLAYGVKLDSKGIKDTYTRLMGPEKELTVDLIDFAIEDNSKRGIEEIQKQLMEIINRGIKNQAETPINESFKNIDKEGIGEISYAEFKVVIKIFVPKIRTVDVMFLAKRYCINTDNKIVYQKFLDEIDLLDRGINPLMSWAENLSDTIVKAIAAKSTDFETLFRTFAPDKNYITEEQFIKAMKSINIDTKFDDAKIMKFYYFIDDDKSQRVEFREMESIIKTHWTKSPQKLMDEILDNLKFQMDENKIKVKDVYSALDGYSRNDLIDTKSFIRALKHDLKFHIDDIDLDFACKYYKDKRDRRSIRYSSLMDDLKQKFQLTETYVVPGQKRKNVVEDEDPLTRILSRKDYSSPVKEEDINTVLKEVAVEAHERRVDLDREFKR